MVRLGTGSVVRVRWTVTMPAASWLSRGPRPADFSVWASTRSIVYRDSSVRPDASFALPSAQPLASGTHVRDVSPQEEANASRPAAPGDKARAGDACRSTGTAPRPLPSGGFDFDRPRRRSSRHSDPHLQHAIHGFRLHLGGVNALGKSETPLERAVRDLADKVLRAHGVVVRLAVALDGEHAVHQGHCDVLRIHSRQGELDDVGTVLEPSLGGRKPRLGPLSSLVHGAVEEPREQGVDIMVEVELPAR